MTGQPSFDLGSAASLLITIVLLLAVIIKLIPILVQVVRHIMPGALALWLIVIVLRAMVHRLLD